jgi:hemoglobin
VTESTLFEVVGGQPYFDALIERFSARVESDPQLRGVYPDDLTAGMRALALFLGQYWGGPPTYSEQKGHPRLRMRHAPFVIGPAQRDAWLAAMLNALDESDVPEVAREMMRDYFTHASTAMINASS